MLSNPLWRGTVADFGRRVREWLILPSPQGLMHLAIFLDAHAVAGDAALLAQVRRDLMALAHDGAEHGVDKTRGARLVRRACEVDRVVHHGRGRHAVQVEQLIDRQTQDDADLDVERLEGTTRERAADMVERALPAQRAQDDIGREGAVAVFREANEESGFGRRTAIRGSLIAALVGRAGTGPQRATRRRDTIGVSDATGGTSHPCG